MSKLVTLKLVGNLEKDGFDVFLEIGEENQPQSMEIYGKLPSDANLFNCINNWEANYRVLESATFTRTKLTQQKLETSIRTTPRNLGVKFKVPLIKGDLGGSLPKFTLPFLNRVRMVTRSIKPKNSQGSRISLKRQVIKCNEAAKDLKFCLQMWLKSDSFQNVNTRLRHKLNETDVIRLLIRTDDPQLYKLPWHEWDLFEDYKQLEYSVGNFNYERINRQSLPAKAEDKVRILVILGNSIGIDTGKDANVFASLADVDPVFLVERSRQDINEQLYQQQWDIIFFAGHSETEGEKGRIYINKTDTLTIDELKYGLKKAIDQGLQLAIFNSCDGLGLAQQLGELQIPQMIFMREPIPDRVAQDFLKYFIAAFAGGSSFYLAHREAREKLQGLQNKFPQACWLPVIWQNAAEVPPSWERLRTGGRIASHDWNKIPQYNYATDGDRISISPPARNPRKNLVKVLSISLAITLLVVGMRSQGVLEPLELWAYDKFMQLQSPPVLDQRILIVGVDDQDVNTYKKPLKDQTINQLLIKLNEYQPRVIGLDIQRHKPTDTQANWENLGKHIQNSQIPTIAICVVGQIKGQINPLQAIAPPWGVSGEHLSFSDGLMFDADGDGDSENDPVRRYSLKMGLRSKSPCQTENSFSYQVVKNYLSNETKYLENLDKKLHRLPPISGGYHRPENQMAGDQILINYRNQNIQDVSVSRIMNGLDTDLQELIQDRIILIGYVSSKSKDKHNTPLGILPGIRIQAQVVAQLLKASESSQPFWSFLPKELEFIYILFGSIIGGYVAILFRSKYLTIAIFGAICLFCIISLSYFNYGVIPIIPTVIALVLSSYIVRIDPISRIGKFLKIKNRIIQ